MPEEWDTLMPFPELYIATAWYLRKRNDIDGGG